MKRYDVLVSANKEAVDALIQFNSVLVSGVREINSHVCALAQSTVDLNLETSKAAIGIKAPQELNEIQAKWIGQLFQTALSGMAKLSEISNRIARRTSEPVQSHICDTVSKIADNGTNLSGKAA